MADKNTKGPKTRVKKRSQLKSIWFRFRKNKTGDVWPGLIPDAGPYGNRSGNLHEL